jgi:para-nitrobenzyl esterase
VPFASPPTGVRRFRAPEAVEPWKGVRDANAFAPPSMQPPDGGPIQGMARPQSSEDSLYLNVWAPPGPGPHPVVVWIHGGREFVGGTDDPLYDGAALAARGVIVVSAAYRLGVFGFLALEGLLGAEYAGSGNNALRDQVAALRWVHEEIAAFGGDPGRVTVAGESSGGLNVASLLAIDAARPLMRAVILESSFGGRPTHAPAQAAAVADAVLARLDINPADATAIVTAPAEALLDAQAAVLASDHFAFRPVIDGVVLERSGAGAVRDGVARDVSILIGTNLDEYDLFARHRPLRAEPTAEQMVNVGSERTAAAIGAAYRNRYPELSDDDRRRRLMTAEEHWIPSIRLAEAQDAAGGAAWMYRFEWSPANAASSGLRASHLMELPFVFGTYDSVPGMRLTGAGPERAALSQTIGDVWARFAATAEPGWQRYDGAARATMIFDRVSAIRLDPDAGERRLWDGLLGLRRGERPVRRDDGNHR